MLFPLYSNLVIILASADIKYSDLSSLGVVANKVHQRGLKVLELPHSVICVH